MPAIATYPDLKHQYGDGEGACYGNELLDDYLKSVPVDTDTPTNRPAARLGLLNYSRGGTQVACCLTRYNCRPARPTELPNQQLVGSLPMMRIGVIPLS